MASNFAPVLITGPKFLALKDLNPFQIVSNVQEANIFERERTAQAARGPSNSL